MSAKKIGSLTVDEQIDLLSERGMLFRDPDKAKNALCRIGYFHLKGYWWDMMLEADKHHFRDNSYFEEVIERYHFDQHLRSILFDALEAIEICMRAQLVYHLGLAYGERWYLDDKLYSSKNECRSILSNLEYEYERSANPMVVRYKSSKPDTRPEAWAILETATFGMLSKIFRSLRDSLPQKQTIAHHFGLQSHRDLSSWLNGLSSLRNKVAHHARLWGDVVSTRKISLPSYMMNPWIKFKVHSEHSLGQSGISTYLETVDSGAAKSLAKEDWDLTPQEEAEFLANLPQSLYIYICAAVYLCQAIGAPDSIRTNIIQLTRVYEDLPLHLQGFHHGWLSDPLWRHEE